MSRWEEFKKNTKNLASNTYHSAVDIKNKVQNDIQLNNSEPTLRLKNHGILNNGSVSIRRDKNGLYYFGLFYDESSPRYKFGHYEWDGPNIHTETKTKGDVKTQGRAGSALVGGLMFGSVGAVVGGSRGRKNKVNTTSVSKEVENKSVGTLSLYSVNSEKVKNIIFENDRQTDSKVRWFFGLQ